MGVSNEAVFSVVEQTQYQAIVKVSLRLKQGNDEAVKKHLALKLKEAREANEALRKSAGELETLYGSASASNEQLMQEFAQLREERRRMSDQMRLEEQKSLNDLAQRNLAEQ